MDPRDYKTASRLSPQINAGASARLNGQPLVTDLTGEEAEAFAHGWRTTDEAETRAGRPLRPGSNEAVAFLTGLYADPRLASTFPNGDRDA